MSGRRDGGGHVCICVCVSQLESFDMCVPSELIFDQFFVLLLVGDVVKGHM